MSTEARYELQRLRRRYFRLRMAEAAFFGGALALVVAMLAQLSGVPYSSLITLAVSSWLILTVILFYRFKLNLLNEKSIAAYLSRNYSQLQESADLILESEEELTQLQQIQRARTAEQVSAVAASVPLPHRAYRAMTLFVASLIMFLILPVFVPNYDSNEAPPGMSVQKPQDLTDTTSSSLASLVCVVSPPAYTGQKNFESQARDLSVPEGSVVRWRVKFSSLPTSAKFIFSGRDSINLVGNVAERKISESGFYQVQWRSNNKTHHSDFYKLEMIADEHPKVEIKDLQQFTRLKFDELRPLRINAALKDDYGVTDALLAATVSKGSGESVKFREEKLRFATPDPIRGKEFVASRFVDLKKLGLEPGDELYFYAQVWDNKVPEPQHARTETFFIAILDTAKEILSTDSGLGVDLMPEYFRSQRQIIIDTEKLLRDKSRISKHQFNATSNELGYDQKVLRLRYGQFLGEEDDAGIGQDAANDRGEQEEDPSKKFGHQHDTKNEHNLVPQKKETHAHEGGVKDPEAKEDPIKAFAHSHDNTEVATFFIQSMKAKLKAAITEMWDAELYLRLYQPEKSLPYQYKALNLLKEISNDSRVYVHRTGFEPAPLKEEKRLTADLSEVKAAANQTKSGAAIDHPAIREALEVLRRLTAEPINPYQRAILEKAGQELSAEALQSPVIHLKSLSLLRLLSDNQLKPAELLPALRQLRLSFWNVLTKVSSSPSAQLQGTTTLDRIFLEKIQQARK